MVCYFYSSDTRVLVPAGFILILLKSRHDVSNPGHSIIYKPFSVFVVESRLWLKTKCELIGLTWLTTWEVNSSVFVGTELFRRPKQSLQGASVGLKRPPTAAEMVATPCLQCDGQIKPVII